MVYLTTLSVTKTSGTTVTNELGSVKGNLARLKLICVIYYKSVVHKSQGSDRHGDQIAYSGT